MKRLTTYITEKLIINKNYKRPYTYAPTTWKKLRHIIEERYNKLGAGTEEDPIDFNDIDVSNVNSFFNNSKGIFEEMNFKYIDISDWDVSNVEDMRYMFFLCTNLTSVGDLSDWDVSNVKIMKHMFYNCKKLESVGDLSKWDVSNVKDMFSMFYNCENLKSIGDISEWNVSNVEDIREMFTNSGIKNISDWYKG